jgi:hypothetical protein
MNALQASPPSGDLGGQKIATHIRTTLMRFINRREFAYKAVIKAGHQVPDYKRKRAAIDKLRIQLAASATWSLTQNIKWIVTMRTDIMLLLPFEFHDDPKQVAYRNHIREVINYCEDSINPKPIH